MKHLWLIFAMSTALMFPQESLQNNVDPDYIRNLVKKYKSDPRGPYSGIFWFCEDGTINPPKEPCEGDGVQHAKYKQEVTDLAKKSHIYLGQILASTDFSDFWDNDNYQSRLKQYLIENYLETVDNGWVNRRAQFYRGAFQAEDEENWGKEFFHWLLEQDEVIEKHFYLVRQAAKDVPHAGDDNLAQKMRAESKSIADAYEPFMQLRIKIHGQPDRSDIQKVKDFEREHASKLSASLKKEFTTLEATMNEYFEPIKVHDFLGYLDSIKDQDIEAHVANFIKDNTDASEKTTLEAASDLMWYLRSHILEEPTGEGRLAILDVSLKLEALIMRSINIYPEEDLASLIDKVCYLSTASAASGYTEIWEWDQLKSALSKTPTDKLSLDQLNELLIAGRNQLEWGTGKNNAVFGQEVERYASFEPLAQSFLDDRIRGSVALYLGNAIGKLGSFISTKSGMENKVLDLPNQSHIHGLNPGYASGKLIVIEGSAENLEVDPANIYVFARPPADLKPVSGILNVSEGNLVSHLQLLARNLGIPNASISSDNIDNLKKFSGKEVFYAVSNKGTVVLKPKAEMTDEEKDLFSKEERQSTMITVPTDKLKLDRTTLMNLSEVDAKSSGIYCGPKAANLGELKKNFPDHVVDGFVIPFGIFLDHMKQTIPNGKESYWDYLINVFKKSGEMKAAGEPAKKIETFELKELAILRKWIDEMTLKPSFVKELETAFTDILGVPMGEQGVFLRSDTNMEDLKSFTGAGLNLTLFNVSQKEAILDGIKAVWASPYTERSFKWRQRLLNNPENVYPSIVVIPGVNNDCSGVMITKGVNSGSTDEITVAFSRGVGGAVEGQAAETWAIPHTGGKNHLIAPSREPFYKSLPKSGSTTTEVASFEKPILSSSMLKDLNSFRKQLEKKMGAQGIPGPYDVELGFKDDKIWLFQVRPYVENKNATSSLYLESISPKIDTDQKISLRTQL